MLHSGCLLSTDAQRGSFKSNISTCVNPPGTLKGSGAVSPPPTTLKSRMFFLASVLFLLGCTSTLADPYGCCEETHVTGHCSTFMLCITIWKRMSCIIHISIYGTISKKIYLLLVQGTGLGITSSRNTAWRCQPIAGKHLTQLPTELKLVHRDNCIYTNSLGEEFCFKPTSEYSSSKCQDPGENGMKFIFNIIWKTLLFETEMGRKGNKSAQGQSERQPNP